MRNETLRILIHQDVLELEPLVNHVVVLAVKSFLWVAFFDHDLEIGCRAGVIVTV